MNRSRSYLLLATMLLTSAFLSACRNGELVAFPEEGRVGTAPDPGSTVVLVFDSNYAPLGDGAEWHDADLGEIEVWIQEPTEPPTWEVQANLRSVFDVRTDSWATLHFSQPGLSATAAVFDLPTETALETALEATPGSLSYPIPTRVVVRRAGAMPLTWDSFRDAPLTIVDAGGTPQEIMDADLWTVAEEQVLQRPTQYALLRLRPKRAAFDPTTFGGQSIGSIEFDFFFNTMGTTCIDHVIAARPQTDAANRGIVMTELFDTVNDQQKVMLVAPRGVVLSFVDVGTFDDELAGEGPIIDLLVAQDGACPLSGTDWFQVRNLVVTNLDGAVLLEAGDGVDPVLVDDPASTEPNAALRAYLVDPTT